MAAPTGQTDRDRKTKEGSRAGGPGRTDGHRCSNHKARRERSRRQQPDPPAQRVGSTACSCRDKLLHRVRDGIHLCVYTRTAVSLGGGVAVWTPPRGLTQSWVKLEVAVTQCSSALLPCVHVKVCKHVPLRVSACGNHSSDLLHSLQAQGGGLLRAPREAGAVSQLCVRSLCRC